jgi:hypothetical protein
MRKQERKKPPVDPNLEFADDFDAHRFISEIEKRETHRSGPGTAARRTLEAIAESARLRRELSGLDDYGD